LRSWQAKLARPHTFAPSGLFLASGGSTIAPDSRPLMSIDVAATLVLFLSLGAVPSGAQVDGTLELAYGGDFRYLQAAWIFPIQAWVAKLVWDKEYPTLMPVAAADKRDFNITIDILDTLADPARTIKWASQLIWPHEGARNPCAGV